MIILIILCAATSIVLSAAVIMVSLTVARMRAQLQIQIWDLQHDLNDAYLRIDRLDRRVFLTTTNVNEGIGRWKDDS